jgi:antitoxin MazE6
MVILGHTLGMKTAISIPDQIFEDAERLAKRLKQSRSEVYSRAVAEYVARHEPDRVTEEMDRVLEEVSEPVDEFVATAARRALRRTEW